MADLRSILGDVFDSDQHEPAAEFRVYNPGQYPAQIDSVELKDTKKGNGSFLEVKMTFLEAPYANQKLTDRINIDNPSVKCVEIGKAQLSALCRAAGVAKLEDTDQLLQKVVVPHVKVRDDQNEVRTYSSLADFRAKQAKQQPASGDQAASPGSPVASPAAPPKHPWNR